MNHLVTLFPNAVTTVGTHINAAAVFDQIRSGKLESLTAAIRSAQSPDQKSILKRKLPGVTWAGTFQLRNTNGLQNSSGLAGMDVDNLDAHAADDLRERAKKLPCVHGAHKTVSAGGVRLITRIDPNRSYLSGWMAAAAEIRTKLGVEVDPSCKDICRLSFINHDPHAFWRDDAEIVCYGLSPTPPDLGDAAHLPLVPSMSAAKVADVLSHVPKPPPERDHNYRTMVVGAVASVLSNDDALAVLQQWAPMPEGKYENDLAHKKTKTTFDYLKKIARQNGWVDQSHMDSPIPEGSLVLPSDPGLSCNEASGKIFAAIAEQKDMFLRARGLIQSISPDGELIHITATAFCSRIEKYGRLMQWKIDRGNKVLDTALCSAQTAKTLMNSEDVHLLPRIRTVVNTPVLAISDKGDELVPLNPGWNPQGGGIFVAGGSTIEIIPLSEAVASLKALLVDFDFESDGDRSRAIASLLTPAFKPSGIIGGSTPIDVMEATESQTGKGFFNKLRAAIYNETPTIITQRKGGVGSLDEDISAALVSGRILIQIDNTRKSIDSPMLEAVLTADGPVQCRIPYSSGVEIDTTPFSFSITSNGVQVTVDLANRCSVIRLKKRPKEHQFQVFPEGNLIAHVKARQAYYLNCVLSVMGQWFVDDSPRTDEARHSFRNWCQIMDWIVQNFFNGAPLMDGHEAAQARISNPSMAWLREVAIRVKVREQLGRELSATEIAEICVEDNLSVPSEKEGRPEADQSMAVGRTMKRLFENSDEVQIEGVTVMRRTRMNSDGKPSRAYVFYS